MEAILVDSLATPIYAWRFRYTASITDAYKWVFIGGSRIRKLAETQVSTNSTTPIIIDSTTPSIVLSRAGYYEFQFGARIGATNGDAGNLALFIAGSLLRQVAIYNENTGGTFHAGATLTDTGLCATGATVELRYSCSFGGTTWFTSRWLTAVPVRVA